MGGKTPSQENSHHSDVILIFPAVETKVQRGSVPCGGGDLNWGTHAKSCSSEDTGIECPVHVFQRLGGESQKEGAAVAGRWSPGKGEAEGRSFPRKASDTCRFKAGSDRERPQLSQADDSNSLAENSTLHRKLP